MLRITINKAVNALVLREELEAAMPEFQSDTGPGFRPLEFYLEETGVVAEVPDNTDTNKFLSIVAAHDPASKTKAQKVALVVLQVYSSAVGINIKDLTNAQLKSVLVMLLYKAGLIDERLIVLPANI